MKRPLTAALWAAFSFSALTAWGQLPPNTWTTGTPMPTAREGAFAGAIGTKIYVIGGSNDTAVLSVNEVYDTIANTWSTAAPMPTARSFGASAVVNNILYAIGGYRSGPVSTVEAYDPAANTWSTKASMPIANDSVFTTFANNIIYVIGGCCSNSQRLATVMSYNPATNAWTMLAPLKVAKSTSALGFINGMIVAAGGLLTNAAATADNEGYTIATNAWATLPPLPDARHAGCFGTAGDTLYIAGGHSVASGNPLSTMDAFNADTNTWQTGLPVMPFAAVNMAPASIGGTLYCFGGSNAGDALSGSQSTTMCRFTSRIFRRRLRREAW